MADESEFEKLLRWHREDQEHIRDLQDQLAQMTNNSALTGELWSSAQDKLRRTHDIIGILKTSGQGQLADRLHSLLHNGTGMDHV